MKRVGRYLVLGTMFLGMVAISSKPLLAGMDTNSQTAPPDEMTAEEVRVELAKVQAFFNRYWLSQSSNNAAEWLQLFDRHWDESRIFIRENSQGGGETTNFPSMSCAEILSERKKLIADYPKRIYHQITDPKVTYIDETAATLRFTFAYQFTGRKILSGKVGVTMGVLKRDDDDDNYTIVLYEEDVRRNPNPVR